MSSDSSLSSAQDERKPLSHLRTFLKGASLYTRPVSGYLLLVIGMLALTFLYDVFLLRRPPDLVPRNSLIIAAALLSVLLGILLHRSRVRHLLRRQPIQDALLNEMAAILVALTFGFCLLAAMAAAR